MDVSLETENRARDGFGNHEFDGIVSMGQIRPNLMGNDIRFDDLIKSQTCIEQRCVGLDHSLHATPLRYAVFWVIA